MDYTENEICLIVNRYNVLRENLRMPIKDFSYKKNGLNSSYKFLTFYFDISKQDIVIKYLINNKINYDTIKIKDLLNYKALNEEVYSE